MTAALCFVSFVVEMLYGEASVNSAHADFVSFHLPSAQLFRHQPWLQAVRNYPSATTPLFAMLGSLGPWGDNVREFHTVFWALCLLTFLLFVWTLGRRFQIERFSPWAWVVGGSLLLSPYFRTESFWPSTDNLALFFLVATAALLQAVKELHEKEHPGPAAYLLAGLVPVVAFGAFYTRQTYLFLPGYAMIVLFWRRPRFRWCSLTGLLAALPAVYLVLIWHGLTPPQFQEHHEGFALAQISFPAAVCAFCALPFFAATPGDLLRVIQRRKLLIACSLVAIPFLVGGVSAFRPESIPNRAGVFASLLTGLHTPGMLVYLVFVAAGVLLLGGLLADAETETRILILGFLLPYLAIRVIYERYFDPVVMVTALLFLDLRLMKRFTTLKAAYLLVGFQLVLLVGSLLHHSYH